MSVEPLRVTFRKQMRERALDAALGMTLESGWDQVRVGAIAEEIGVSRPTLYREFGNKEGVAEALVMREVGIFLDAIAEVLTQKSADIGVAIAAAAERTLIMAGENPLLRAVLTGTRDGGDSLLPFLTIRSAPLLNAATEMLTRWFAEHHPELDQLRIAEAIDAVVRLVVSHLVLPLDGPRPVARQLSLLATRYVGLPDSI
jgi:AcrR family transcriptional regulator